MHTNFATAETLDDTTDLDETTGVHARAELPMRDHGEDDAWPRLVAAWRAGGWGDAPPDCLDQYAEELLEAIS